jgi:hypothetical protein
VAFFDARTRDAAYAFLLAHFDELADKLPEQMRTFLLFGVSAMCDDARTAELEQRHGARIATFDGGPRVMAQVREWAALCAVQRQVQTPGVVAFLARE